MVAEHKHDHTSNVVSIALLTLKIRNMQKDLGLLAQRGWRCPGKKRALARFINARRAQLGFLRKQDYPKYEWLLEKLTSYTSLDHLHMKESFDEDIQKGWLTCCVTKHERSSYNL